MLNNSMFNPEGFSTLQEVYNNYFSREGSLNEIGQLVISVLTTEDSFNSNYDISSEIEYNVHLVFTEQGIFNAVGNYLCNWEVIEGILSLPSAQQVRPENLIQFSLNQIADDFYLGIDLE